MSPISRAAASSLKIPVRTALAMGTARMQNWLLVKVAANQNDKMINFQAATILKLIFIVYIYMMSMASANVINCEVRQKRICSDQWTQAFTVAGGAATTLWAFITDNPTQDSKKQPTRKPTQRRKPTTVSGRRKNTKNDNLPS